MATIGNTDISAGLTTLAANYKIVSQWTASANGVLSNARVYIGNAGGAAAAARFIVYQAPGPSAFIAASEDLSIAAGQAPGWVTFTFITPPTLVSGTSYMLGFHVSATLDVGYKANAGVIRYYYGPGDAFAGGTNTAPWEGSNSATGVELAVAADIGAALPALPKAIRIKAASGWVDLSQGVAKDPIFDAKGDLVVGLAADVGVRLPVGADGKTLIADSTQALGVKWETPAGLQGRTTIAHTTASLALDAAENFTLTVVPGWRCFRIVTSRAARIQLYRTAAQRTADISRLLTADPTGDHGLMLEFVTTEGDLDWALTPTVDFHSEDGGSDFYGRITNLGSTGTVQVTFHYVRTE